MDHVFRCFSIRPKKQKSSETDDLFRHRPDNILDRRHELFRLVGLIDWEKVDRAFGRFCRELDRPGKPTRLMVGLSYSCGSTSATGTMSLDWRGSCGAAGTGKSRSRAWKAIGSGPYSWHAPGWRHDLENQVRGLPKVFGLLVGQATGRGLEIRVPDLIEEELGLGQIILPLLAVPGGLRAIRWP